MTSGQDVSLDLVVGEQADRLEVSGILDAGTAARLDTTLLRLDELHRPLHIHLDNITRADQHGIKPLLAARTRRAGTNAPIHIHAADPALADLIADSGRRQHRTPPRPGSSDPARPPPGRTVTTFRWSRLSARVGMS